MNVLHKYTIETLKKNKTRTIVTILGIALSMMLFTAVIEGAFSGKSYLEDCIINLEGPYHGIAKNLTKEQARGIINDKDIEKSEYIEDIGWGDIHSKNTAKPYIRVCNVSNNLGSLCTTKLTKGRMPKNSSEIVIPEHLSTNGEVEYNVGDTLNLQLGSRIKGKKELHANEPFSEEGKEHLDFLKDYSFKVVGIMERPDTKIESFDCAGYTAYTKAPGVGPVDVAFTVKDISSFKDVESRLADKYNITIYRHSDLLGLYGVTGDGDFSKILVRLTVFLVLLVMAGSISLIYNSFSISIGERTKQFGILKSIGASKKQIRSCIIYEASVLASIAIPIGMVVGCAGIGTTLFLLRDSFSLTSTASDVKIHLVLNPWMLLIAAGVCYITILISAWLPARRAVKMTAIDSIRQVEDIKISPKSVKTSKLTYKLWGFEGMLAKKNFKRNKKRYRSTIISLIASILLFVTTSAFSNMLKTTVNGELSYGGADIRWTSDEQVDTKEVVTALADTSKADEHTYYNVYYSSNFTLPKGKFDPIYVKAHKDAIKKDYCCLDVAFLEDSEFKKICESNDLKVSDYFDKNDPKGVLVNRTLLKVDGKYKSIPIVKEDAKNLQFETIDDEYTFKKLNVTKGIELKHYAFPVDNEMVIYPYSMESVIVPEDKKNLSYRVGSFNAKDYKGAYDKMSLYLKGKGMKQGGLFNIKENVVVMNTITHVISVFTLGFIIIMALITVADIFNTISTNVLLRRKEFAMMKSVGLSNHSFRKMLNFECLIYGFKSLIFGIPISTICVLLMFKLTHIEVELMKVFPWKSIIISTILVFTVVFISMIYAGKKICYNNPIDALKNDAI